MLWSDRQNTEKNETEDTQTGSDGLPSVTSNICIDFNFILIQLKFEKNGSIGDSCMVSL